MSYSKAAIEARGVVDHIALNSGGPLDLGTGPRGRCTDAMRRI